MDINFILPTKHPGGGVRVVFEYADRLTARGHDVTICYPIIPPHPVKLIGEQDLVTLLNKAFSTSNINWETEANLVRVPGLLKPFIENAVPPADFTIATSWRTVSPVSKLSDKFGTSIHFVQHYEIWDVWNSHICWEKAESIANNTNEKIAIAMSQVQTQDLPVKSNKPLIDDLYGMINKKITISSWLQELLTKEFEAKVLNTITNGVNHSKFRPGKQNNSPKIQILSIYRDVEWKGTEDVLQAFRKIKMEFDNVEFKMFGPTDAKLPDWIKLRSGISDSELRQLYSKSDIFVLPSWIEGCQLPPMEAMACGTAVVATDVGGIPDYAVSGKTALTVPPRKPEALTDQIRNLIENPERREQVAEQGHKHIQRFTWTRATDSFEETLEKEL